MGYKRKYVKCYGIIDLRIRSFIVNYYIYSNYIDYYYSKMIAPHIIQYKHSFLKNLENIKNSKKVIYVNENDRGTYIFKYDTTKWCTTFIKAHSDTTQRAGAAANRCLFTLVTFELFISRTRKIIGA